MAASDGNKRRSRYCLRDEDLESDELADEARENCSVSAAPDIRRRMHGNSSVFRLYVRVMAMIGKLVPRVTTGKSGRKYCRKGMG